MFFQIIFNVAQVPVYYFFQYIYIQKETKKQEIILHGAGHYM